MHKHLKLFLALIVAVALSPLAMAEDWPPPNTERFVVYWGDVCGETMEYKGHFEVECDGTPHYQGNRSGKWRAIYDTNCSTYASTETYQVCTSGVSCTGSSGTWTNITYEQFAMSYCPNP